MAILLLNVQGVDGPDPVKGQGNDFPVTSYSFSLDADGNPAPLVINFSSQSYLTGMSDLAAKLIRGASLPTVTLSEKSSANEVGNDQQITLSGAQITSYNEAGGVVSAT